VDVGANVGAYTVLASGVAGAKSISFEPSPSTFWYLARNVKLNDLEKLSEPFNLALGKEEGQMHLTKGWAPKTMSRAWRRRAGPLRWG